MRFAWDRFSLDFTSKTCLMGILNVTPDSFSDGGEFFAPEKAVTRAMEMVEEGADIIDIGGQSTRPGSEPVALEEEIRRTAPVIEAIAGKIDVPVSIDTYQSAVAKSAIGAGASIVNDISGLRFDPRMAEVCSKAKVPVVLMHIKGTPVNMQKNPTYDALVPEVMDYLRQSIKIARDAGIEHIAIDPGLGFGKTFDHNLEIIAAIDEFVRMGYPVCIGPSRKAFIGAILGGAQEKDRLEGTAAVVAASVLKGANILRVHDVKQMKRVVTVAEAIVRGRVTP
jgi:dihydropteroate synthase